MSLLKKNMLQILKIEYLINRAFNCVRITCILYVAVYGSCLTTSWWTDLMQIKNIRNISKYIRTHIIIMMLHDNDFHELVNKILSVFSMIWKTVQT